METLPALGDVRLFLAVARLGGFSAAARELGISPGAVSKQIARLERAFDASLFERNTRHVALTAEGRRIAVHAREALRELEQAAEVTAGKRDALSGVVRLSAPVSFGRKHVTRAIAEFRAENPDVEFELHLSDRGTDLLVNDLDLALVLAHGAAPEANVVARRLASSRRLLVASPAYLERYGAPRVLADLKARVTLVEARGGAATSSWPLVSERKRARVAVAGALRSDSTDVVREWCLAGLGIALCDGWDVAEDVELGTLVRVLPAWEGEESVLRAVRLRGEPLPRRVAAFVGFAKERWAEHAPW
ncbi:MAG TPA: LysR family transcriptional regulator [Polyangiaceae bacterium]|nr:LysR family transcriptional regulator [Polyangiaceae bacterium]